MGRMESRGQADPDASRRGGWTAGSGLARIPPGGRPGPGRPGFRPVGRLPSRVDPARGIRLGSRPRVRVRERGISRARERNVRRRPAGFGRFSPF